MKWYVRLYLGEKAKKAKYKVFGLIKKKRFQPDTFLIMLPCNSDNLLDIVSANYILQPHFKKQHNNDFYVVGLAKGKQEALEVVQTIIDDVYGHTGGFDIPGYLHFGKKRK